MATSSSSLHVHAAHGRVSFGRLYVAFAGAYLLSYAFRTGNAVISPELTRELALSPGALGLLTSGYFLAFGLMQLPAGMLLDRYGPRRVEPAFLAIAGAGSLAFATAASELGLLVARGLIGVGVATCLMAPLKAIAAWYPAHRHASLSGWMMAAGGLGALLVTVPLELALRFITWRTVFVVFGVSCFAVALLIWLRVPDMEKPRRTSGLATQCRIVGRVFATARFWWLAPLGALGMGAFGAVQGLWSVPWLMEVQGYDRATAARHLLVLSFVTVVGYTLLGGFATRLSHRGVTTAHLYASGFVVSILGLAAIVAELPGSYLWWSVYGFGAAVNVLGFTLLNEGFSRELAARANTALNLVMFMGSFGVQWGIGVIVDSTRRMLGYDTAGGLRVAFATVLTLEIASYLWFVFGLRAHMRPHEAVIVAS